MLSTHYMFAVLSILGLITFKPLGYLSIGIWFLYLVWVCYQIAKAPSDDGATM